MGEIPLTQGKVTLVDDSDFEWLSRHKCYAMHCHAYKKDYWYAGAYIHGKQVFIHRLIAGTAKDMVTDHKNGDGLDNRRENLRTCTIAENTHNQNRQTMNKSSEFKGVYWYKPRKIWRAIIKIGMKRLYLGHYKVEEDAARAYDRAAVKYHGEFANLNFGI
jgi:hypothetical protein